MEKTFFENAYFIIGTSVFGILFYKFYKHSVDLLAKPI